MAEGNAYALAAAAAAKEQSTSNKSAAVQQTEEVQLAEMVNQEACRSCEIELKVIRAQIVGYTYSWNGKQVETQKLQVILQSKVAEQYCIGVARLQKQDKAELQKMQTRFQVGSTWKFRSITLMNEKSAYIHTPCRIAVDLRKSKADALLQSMSFPSAPVPVVTIADILQLKDMQRFDLMAIVAAILQERKGNLGLQIFDVRLVDGSQQHDSDGKKYTSLPMTLFLKDESEISLLKDSLGKKPLLFMSLNGLRKNGEVCVSPTKDQFWFCEASGPRSTDMARDALHLCNNDADLTDVASLSTFVPNEAKDFITPVATLSVCHLIEDKHLTRASALGEASEHLYQLNHVHVVVPNKTDAIKTSDGRLFARLDVWDCSKRISLAFRSKAMLQLAGYSEDQADEYVQALENDELRHPLLASLRVHVQLKESNAPENTDATEPSESLARKIITVVVVEAASCTGVDMGKEAVQSMQTLLTGFPQSSERMAAMPLHKVKPSPFYNMIADNNPVDKILTILHFTQRSFSKQHANTIRMVSSHVRDASVDEKKTADTLNSFGTIALRSCERINDFSPGKGSIAIAVISKVVEPALPQQNVADLFIEALEVIESKDDIASSTKMIRQLQEISSFVTVDALPSSQVAWEQRKCRRLLRYPTIEKEA